MTSKTLVVPVGVALAALLANTSEAAKVPTETRKGLLDVHGASMISKEFSDPILKELMVRVGEETHTLTLHKSTTGILYAGHGSHISHDSHVSHGSHRSGR